MVGIVKLVMHIYFIGFECTLKDKVYGIKLSKLGLTIILRFMEPLCNLWKIKLSNGIAITHFEKGINLI